MPSATTPGSGQAATAAPDVIRRRRLIDRLTPPIRPDGARRPALRRQFWRHCVAWLSVITAITLAMLLWLQADTRNVVTTFRRSNEFSWMPMQTAIWNAKLRTLALRSLSEPWSEALWLEFDNARDVFFHRVTVIVDSHELTSEFRIAPSFAEASARLQQVRESLDEIELTDRKGLNPAQARALIDMLDKLDPIVNRLIADLRNIDIDSRATIYETWMSRRDALRWVTAAVWLILSCFGVVLLLNRARRQEDDLNRHERLEQKLAAMQTAEELIETRNSILNMVAHDLRSPLQVLMSTAETLQMKLPADQPELLELARQIDNTTEQIATHLRDLNTFAKTLDANISTQEQLLDLDEIAQSAFTTQVRELARTKGVAVHIAVDGMKRGLHADRTRIVQILGNLIENAVKYTDRGSVNVLIETRPRDEQSVMLTFSITDTGVGMTPKEVKQAFDPFVRLTHAQAGKIPGFGLGLSLVKHLVELLHGTMEVRSTPGIGSAFLVSLPTIIGQSGGLATGSASANSVLAVHPDAVTVLIVDDVPEVLNALIDSVKRQGAVALGAGNATEAIALSNVHHFDLALIDYQMPVCNGLALAADLSRRHPKMHLVMISAFPEPDVFNEEALRTIGAHGFAEKPLKGATIRRLIDAAQVRET